MLRMDAAVARLAATVASALGRRVKPADFMPWPKEEPAPASALEVLAYLRSKVKRKDSDGGK